MTLHLYHSGNFYSDNPQYQKLRDFLPCPTFTAIFSIVSTPKDQMNIEELRNFTPDYPTFSTEFKNVFFDYSTKKFTTKNLGFWNTSHWDRSENDDNFYLIDNIGGKP